MIFNMNGGGTALNFRVVGGTSTPSDPKENTIWVNTNATITDWVFSADEPSTWKLCSAAGEILGSIDGYTLTKKNAGNAVFAFASNGTYAIPMLISDNRNAAIIRRSDGTTIDAGTTYGYNGKTYYLTFPGYNLNSFGTLVPKYTDSADPYKAIEFLVDKLLAQKQAEGIVWISTGTSSTAEFNALKKNSIQVYPISAKQYVNGAWVVKTAKSYQGGAWCDWNPAGALFWHGNQFTSLTGGWDSGSVWGDSPATFTASNNMLNISHSSANRYSSNALKCVNKLSLAGAKVLKCNVAAMSGTLETFDFCVKGSTELSNMDTAAKVSISTTGEITLDVSNLSGSYYIYFYSYTTSKDFAYSIDRVWYE